MDNDTKRAMLPEHVYVRIRPPAHPSSEVDLTLFRSAELAAQASNTGETVGIYELKTSRVVSHALL
jgi:hypothetical protein